MMHPNEAIPDLENETVYANAMFAAAKLGPKFCEALREQRNAQVAARIAEWKSQQTTVLAELEAIDNG